MATCRLTRTCTRLGLCESALRKLLHALGVQKRVTWSAGGWRNYYSTSAGCDSLPECKDLEKGGWLRRVPSVSYDGSEYLFVVTDAGIAALRLAGWRIDEEVTP